MRRRARWPTSDILGWCLIAPVAFITFQPVLTAGEQAYSFSRVIKTRVRRYGLRYNNSRDFTLYPKPIA
jgi:hypothetical protein